MAIPPHARVRWVFIGLLLLLVNSACVWVFAEPTPWYFAQVVLHPVLGLCLAAVVVRELTERRRRVTPVGWVGLSFSGVGAALGLGPNIGAIKPTTTRAS